MTNTNVKEIDVKEVTGGINKLIEAIESAAADIPTIKQQKAELKEKAEKSASFAEYVSVLDAANFAVTPSLKMLKEYNGKEAYTAAVSALNTLIKACKAYFYSVLTEAEESIQKEKHNAAYTALKRVKLILHINDACKKSDVEYICYNGLKPTLRNKSNINDGLVYKAVTPSAMMMLIYRMTSCNRSENTELIIIDNKKTLKSLKQTLALLNG